MKTITITIKVKDEDCEDNVKYMAEEIEDTWGYEKDKDFTIEVSDNTQ